MPDIAIQALSKNYILLTDFTQRNLYFAFDYILSQYMRPLYKKYEYLILLAPQPTSDTTAAL